MMGRPCEHPKVYLDGVPVSSPDQLYGMLSLHTIEQLEVIPPGEAGARFGTGSLYGVILITTQRPRCTPSRRRSRAYVRVTIQ